jgi:multiple sugar transport system substrate-binding protein
MIVPSRALVLAAVLLLTPLSAQAADLVIWWDKGFYPQEDEAVRDIIAAFEQKTGKRVELVSYEQAELQGKLDAALAVGQPPDFAFGLAIAHSKLAFEDRLTDLTDTVGSFSDLFDPGALARYTLLDGKTGQRALYALPMGRASTHLHVWKSLVEQAGFTLADVPKQWNAFWSFWCDQVQPAVRRATGRDDIWGVGLNMSAKAGEVNTFFLQFLDAYDAEYVTGTRRLAFDDPEIRRGLIKAIEAYTAVYRKGCTPPGSISWDTNRDNNNAFLGQAVVMVVNDTLSIPNALKHERPKDYYSNTATIEWPLGPTGEAFPIEGGDYGAVVFKDGGHVGTATEFVRFLVAEGWLAHYLDFAGQRMLPPMPKLRDAPFWLNPGDPHLMAAVMQIASRPTQYDYATISGDRRLDHILEERVWGKAIHRIVTENISPEQAVDEAIARIKQILAE